MGANACNGICEKTSVIETFDDQFLPTQTLIPCQICNVHLDETKFKQHIDHDHFCCICENHEGLVNAKCLLCQHLSLNLDEQSQHINSKHPYAKSNKKPQDQKSAIMAMQDSKQRPVVVELYKKKKERVHRLNSAKEFQVLNSEEDNKVEVSIKGEKYEGEIKIKQYRGLQFDEPLAEAELIWFKVFRGEKDYTYFYLDVDPKERTIVCKAYLFTHKQ